MKKIEKLQKFLDQFIPNVYWTTTYEGKIPTDINNDNPDWNQTLITKINEVSARIYKDGTRTDNGPETILISGKYSDMQGLIHSLEYFKTDITHRTGYYVLGKLAGRFDVLVIPELSDEKKIFICKVQDKTKNPYDVQNYVKVGVVKVQTLNQ